MQMSSQPITNSNTWNQSTRIDRWVCSASPAAGHTDRDVCCRHVHSKGPKDTFDSECLVNYYGICMECSGQTQRPPCKNISHTSSIYTVYRYQGKWPPNNQPRTYTEPSWIASAFYMHILKDCHQSIAYTCFLLYLNLVALIPPRTVQQKMPKYG